MYVCYALVIGAMGIHGEDLKRLRSHNTQVQKHINYENVHHLNYGGRF